MAERELTEPVSGEATEEESARHAELEDTIEAQYAEQRVNMRWSGASLEVVKRAAELHGVPYQTYVKQVAFRQALNDLRDARFALRSAAVATG